MEAQGELPVQEQDQELIFAKNQVELAKHLGCNRRTLARYLKIEGNPGCSSNGSYNVTLWKMWVAKYGRLKPARGSDAESLKTREAQLRIERMEMELAEARGDLNSAEETCNVLSSLFASLVSRFTSLKHELAPALVGVSVAEATKRLDSAFTGAFTDLSVADWAKKKAFWRIVSRHLSSLQGRFCPTSGLVETSSSTPVSVGTEILSS